jgi:CheY-like chemotaxis protein
MILLVEDDTISRWGFAEMLRATSYEVLEAGDGAEALALVRKHRRFIELLITDLVIPKLNGLTLMEKVRTLLPDCPIIMISGYMSKIGGEDILGRRAEFLQKPVSLDALLSVVQRVLPHPQIF